MQLGGSCHWRFADLSGWGQTAYAELRARTRNGKRHRESCACQARCLPKGTRTAAFDGSKVFGEHAMAVCKHLVGRQGLWGGTHWWPVEYMRFMLPSDVFNAEDFAAAATWSTKFAQLDRGRNRGR